MNEQHRVENPEIEGRSFSELGFPWVFYTNVISYPREKKWGFYAQLITGQRLASVAVVNIYNEPSYKHGTAKSYQNSLVFCDEFPAGRHQVEPTLIPWHTCGIFGPISFALAEHGATIVTLKR